MSSSPADDEVVQLTSDLSQARAHTPEDSLHPSQHAIRDSDEHEVESIMSPLKRSVCVTRSQSRASSATSARSTNAGPRVNRAAALRQGIAYPTQDATSRRRSVVNFGTTPGHKRDDLKLTVPSLAPPTVTPRVNRATRIRMSVVGPSSCEPACPRVPLGLASPSRTGNTPSREAVASPSNLKMSARRPVSMSARLGAPGAHKSPDLNASQKQKTEHAKPAENTNDAAAAVSAMSVRRRTMAVAPPLSLEPPAITSRSNRTTTLRTSGAMPEFGPTTPSHRRTFSRADVQAKEKAIYEGVPGHKQESKRVAVKSVAEPDVAPRINRAAALRQDPSLAFTPPRAPAFKARPLPAMYRTPTSISGRRSTVETQGSERH